MTTQRTTITGSILINDVNCIALFGHCVSTFSAFGFAYGDKKLRSQEGNVTKSKSIWIILGKNILEDQLLSRNLKGMDTEVKNVKIS